MSNNTAWEKRARTHLPHPQTSQGQISLQVHRYSLYVDSCRHYGNRFLYHKQGFQVISETKTSPCVDFLQSESLPYTAPDHHHHILDSRNFPLNIIEFLDSNQGDPAVVVCHLWLVTIYLSNPTLKGLSLKVWGTPHQPFVPSNLIWRWPRVYPRREKLTNYREQPPVLPQNYVYQLYNLWCSSRTRLSQLVQVF